MRAEVFLLALSMSVLYPLDDSTATVLGDWAAEVVERQKTSRPVSICGGKVEIKPTKYKTNYGGEAPAYSVFFSGWSRVPATAPSSSRPHWYSVTLSPCRSWIVTAMGVPWAWY